MTFDNRRVLAKFIRVLACKPVVMFYKVQNELKPVMKFITFNILKSFAVIQLSEITWSSPKLAKCF